MKRAGRGAQTAPGQRQLRVGEELRHALDRILREGHLRDPALTDTSVTVSEVRLGPDLRNATVFVLPLGGRNTDQVVAALKRATPYLRGQLARSVHLKYMPDLHFAADPTFDYADRIEGLIRAEHAHDRDDGDGA